MTARNVVHAIVTAVKALLIAWVLLFIAEQFGWSLVREAGGGA